MDKPRVAVHKFTSCDGCQLTLLGMGEALLALAERVDFVHFAEAGIVNEQAKVDVAIIEGSVSTQKEQQRIQHIRENSDTIISIGACAVSGGIQALRNGAPHAAWLQTVYPQSDSVDSIATSKPIKSYVKVDHELPGCPISSKQLLALLVKLLLPIKPHFRGESVCHACKQAGNACVIVTQQQACLGPITREGCDALCPSVGRGCYGCFGRADAAQETALKQQLFRMGYSPDEITRRFAFITGGEKSES